MDARERVRRLVELAGPQGLTGFEIGEITGLWPHRLYPALLYLERGGMLVSDWDGGLKPRHRRYWLPYYAVKAA